MKYVVKVDNPSLPEGELVYVAMLEKAIPNGGSDIFELTSDQAKDLNDAYGLKVSKDASKEAEKKGGE